MKLALFQNAAPFEILEQRLALSFDATHEAYYPEGFANSTITESVTINNPGAAPVQFELWARYETGQRDQLIRSGTLAPGAFHDIQISDPANPAAIMVRPDAPFSLVLKSDGELSASLRHDDFGATAGESFTTDTSDDWSFARVTRNATTRDFLIFYNPNDAQVQVQVEFWNDSQMVYSVSAPLGALRRGGWNIARLTGLAPGDYGVRIVSSASIVAALTHYDTDDRVASTHTGARDRGAFAGAILAAEFDDPERPGAPLFDNTYIAVFNPNPNNASVTLNYIIRDGSSFSHQPTTMTLAPFAFTLVPLRQMGFTDHEVSVVYESSHRVAVAGFTHRQHTFFVTPATRVAATQWTFPAGFIDRVNASTMQTEDVIVFNPANTSVNVTLTFTFRNGSTSTESRTILPFEAMDIRTFHPVQGIGAGHTYSVRVNASGQVVASLQHFNRRGLLGTFLAHGLPGGTVTPLNDVLVVPGG